MRITEERGVDYSGYRPKSAPSSYWGPGSRTHTAGWDRRAMKTVLSGPKNGNADATTHKARNHRVVWFVSFGGILRCQLTDHSIGFTAKETISSQTQFMKGVKCNWARQKGAIYFSLLFYLMGDQHLHKVLGLADFGICVGNADIQNTISARVLVV